MSTAGEALRAFVRDHPVTEIDVAAAARRGHRRFLGWLVLRSVVAIVLGVALVAGVLEARSLTLGSSSFFLGLRARLVVTPATGTEPLTVTADASGSTPGWASAIAAVRFDFGDGTSQGPQSDPRSSHTYEDPGRFPLTVTVSDTRGRSDQATVIVSVAAGPTESPRASLTVTPPSGRAALRVVADASRSEGGAGAPIKSYRFDFGDGSAQKTQQEATCEHTYKRTGTFQVTVLVLDTNGGTDRSTAFVTVVPRPQPLRPALRAVPLRGFAPLEVELDASGSSAADGASITRYRFDFGDGEEAGPQPQSHVRHTYRSPGKYSARVAVTDSSGATGEAVREIEVFLPPTARLVVSPSVGPAPLEVTADAARSSPGSGTITSYAFDFGDGPQDPQPNPQATYTYSSSGGHTVTVTVTDENDASGTASQTVTVVRPEPKPPPVVPTSRR